MFYIGLYSEKLEKIFLSAIIRPKVLIFGIQHHLVNFYQVCLNYAPGTKNGPAPGVSCFTLAYIVKNMKNISSLKPYGLDS